MYTHPQHEVQAKAAKEKKVLDKHAKQEHLKFKRKPLHEKVGLRLCTGQLWRRSRQYGMISRQISTKNRPAGLLPTGNCCSLLPLALTAPGFPKSNAF
jgi:hypothetical protein